MPSHDRWGAHARQSRLPPTPPEYQTSYLTPMSAMSDEAHGYYTKRHSYGSRDFQDQYHRAPGYGVQHARGRSKQSSHMQDYAMNYPQPLPMQYQYGNTNLPMLPPIQVPEDLNQYASQYTHAHPEVKAKEEKPTGGVAQHLDYEMDLMAKFVAEMCHQMVTRTTKDPTSHFHKYVSQILSSTRLPSSTIMLGLFYLQERMKIELQLRTDLSSSGALMRMLTTCLLLGSKFLDDNTFQNRSWAEVSNISVHELNSMELEWLKGFNWEIHSMMYDREEGFFMWVDHWHAYEEKAQVQKAKELQKLAPINTNIDRHTAIHQPLLSPDGPIPPQYQQGSQYDTRWARPILEYSPPSAPHSGPTTPEYYNNWHYAPISDSFGVQPWSAQNKSAYHAQRSHLGNYHGQYYNQGYASETNWRGHGAGCGCRGCLHQSEYYMAPAGYPLQPVVG